MSHTCLKRPRCNRTLVFKHNEKYLSYHIRFKVIPFLVIGMAALVLAAEQGLGIRILNILCSIQ